ncbi:MAG: secretion protein, partial [Bacteroidetes bacterium CG18_big_fil_WC_8_21_14_2_50_41_14]
YGTPENGIGKADDLVLSLGDGGVATCLFTTPLADGPGWDFAVFENSFDDTFLELAFVEVSSDGENFVRFSASSLTQTETQVLTFGILDATQLNNLAGKYRGRYGVPFDLNELSGESGLDINHIVAIRLVDVVGSLSPLWQSFDQEGRIINDPWPTPFETGGFDLDAVGVIHNQNNTGILLVDAQNNFLIYPNPINGILFFQSERPVERLSVFSSSGKTVFQSENQQQLTIPTEDWPAGIYVARLVIENRILTSKLVKLK